MSRPERTKTSYQNQVAQLKRKLADTEARRKDLFDMLKVSNAKCIKYRYAPITKRIKYVITREI